MFDAYCNMFDIYLNACSNSPKEDLVAKCKLCQHLKYQLFGMVDLMKEMKEISYEELQNEYKRISETFSTIKLFNASLKDGEVMAWIK